MTEPFEPDDFRDEQQEYLYNLIGFHDNQPQDSTLHELFWEVMYNDELTADDRTAEYENLLAYLYDEYGMNFEDLWDWEDFREWYDA